MKVFSLYGTSACHLCEIAEAMIEAERAREGGFTLEKVDISESDELFQRYGLVIPVLGHPQGPELHWPFSEEQVRAFLNS